MEMTTLPKAYMVRVRMDEATLRNHPNCAYCREPLKKDTVGFLDTGSLELYHLKDCRRDAVREVVKAERLTATEVIRRFGVDRPAAFRIVDEVRSNGSF